ncbi:MAG: nucleotide sugar dehydrogenase [Anaerolineaceae bacterium]|nr:nucleotide sugar dehydrogenase [Anaerolineaceae bacterium]
MNICVEGLWHLGAVTAACLASGGHHVSGLDFDNEVVNELTKGFPPIYEPDLKELINEGIINGNLIFTSDCEKALEKADLVWITYDTPVDDNDQADVKYVIDRVQRIFPYLTDNMTILISSQLPVGTTRELENLFKQSYPNTSVTFCYSPENLRLGKAINVFKNPDRVVVGLRNDKDREKIVNLFSPFTLNIEWMNVESAEMTKHAINAFLATSVVFINELAEICEKVGADAKEVERGLKSESRIGPKSYLGPGVAFSGGTLARDIDFLIKVSHDLAIPSYLFHAVKASNQAHKHWAIRKLEEEFIQLNARKIALWGLTYKPGTDTLRRSMAIDLCQWLISHNAQVMVHDPVVKVLPDFLKEKVRLCLTPIDAIQDTDALIITTEWPEYKLINSEEIVSKMKKPIIIDANRFLERTLGFDNRINYLSVGKAKYEL